MEGNTAYLRGSVDPITRDVLVSEEMREQIADIVLNSKYQLVCHNARFDLNMVRFLLDQQSPCSVIDTMILAHIATQGRELTYALKPLCKKYVDFSDEDEDILKKAVNDARRVAKRRRWSFATEEIGGGSPAKADYWMAPDELCKEYAVGDVLRCMLLTQLWLPEVEADKDMHSLFAREHELFWVLKEMEDTGVRVYPKDVDELITFYEDYQQQQIDSIHKMGYGGLNYNSPKQMCKVFYEERGHKPALTENGNHSLNGERLLEIANGVRLGSDDDDDEAEPTYLVPPDLLAKAVLELRAAKQTVSTFLEVYKRFMAMETESPYQFLEDFKKSVVDDELSNFYKKWMLGEEPDVWVLHPNFKQTGTVTGRLSCSDPNLMQVASATTGRRKADIQSRPREAFGPRPGCYWYLPDYSQIEVWLFAFLSGEETMQKALLSGEDFHGGIAKQVFGNRPDFDENKSYYRKCAKLIMFCKLYGGGAKKVALLLKVEDKARCNLCLTEYKMATNKPCSKCGEGTVMLYSKLAQAQDFITQYEAKLPGVKTFMSRMMTRASREGEIRNPFGRRYYFESDFAYKSVNYLIQGTAADVMKNALVNVSKMLKKLWGGVPRLLLTIHDEIVIEVPAHLHSKKLMRDIIGAMQVDSTTLGLPVPLPVGMKIVKPKSRWHKTHEIELEMAA